MNAAFWFAAWIAASLPWRSSAVFGVVGRWPNMPGTKKPLWLCLIESLALYISVFAALFAVEIQRGQRSPQGWQFWAVALCLWVVLAFPAAAWFKLRK